MCSRSVAMTCDMEQWRAVKRDGDGDPEDEAAGVLFCVLSCLIRAPCWANAPRWGGGRKRCWPAAPLPPP
jgi:hypothetical protein